MILTLGLPEYRGVAQHREMACKSKKVTWPKKSIENFKKNSFGNRTVNHAHAWHLKRSRRWGIGRVCVHNMGVEARSPEKMVYLWWPRRPAVIQKRRLTGRTFSEFEYFMLYVKGLCRLFRIQQAGRIRFEPRGLTYAYPPRVGGTSEGKRDGLKNKF